MAAGPFRSPPSFPPGLGHLLFRQSEAGLLAARTPALRFQARLPGMDPRQVPAIPLPHRACSTTEQDAPRSDRAASSTGYCSTEPWLQKRRRVSWI